MKNFVLLFLFVLAACAHSKTDDFANGPQATFQMRPYEEMALPNGLRLLLIRDQSLPRIGLDLMVMTGSINDPTGKLGLAAFTGEMIDNATQKRSALKMADEFGQIASGLSVSVGSDSTLFSASTIANEKNKLLELFSESVLRPAFDPKEINRERAQVLAKIAKRQDNPSHYADLLINQETYGPHPYAHPSEGEPDTVKSLRREDLANYFHKYYTPPNCILSITGAFDDAFVDRVKMIFLSWHGPAVESYVGLPFKPFAPDSIKLFTKPELKQAQIRLAERGIKRTDPDYLPLKLANLILGGDFVSRLNMKVRDELGLTYSIHSSSEARLDFGAFEISTFSRNEKVGQTVTETQKVIREFVDKGVTSAELDAAKALLAGQFPAAVETTDSLANTLALLRLYHVDDDYVRSFIPNLGAVTLDQVNAAIKNHIHPEDFRVVVFADETKVADQLKAISKVEIEKVKSN